MEELFTEDSNSDDRGVEEKPKAQEGIAEKLRRCLAGLSVPDIERKDRFIDTAVGELVILWEFSANNTSARSVLNKQIHAGTLIQNEVKLWLEGIHRRLSGRRSLRRPFFAEIHRFIPREFFDVLSRVVRVSYGFAPPFCFQNKNKKAEIISFTTIRLVKEIFCLLTGMSGPEIMKFFNKNISSGVRSGHKTSVIVDESKEFAFMYKYRKGELTVSYHYGEWNICGAPRHN